MKLLRELEQTIHVRSYQTWHIELALVISSVNVFHCLINKSLLI